MALTWTQITALRDEITGRSSLNPPSNNDDTRTTLAYQKLSVMFGYYLVKTTYAGTSTAKGIFSKTQFISFTSGHGYTSATAVSTGYLNGTGGSNHKVNITAVSGVITAITIHTAGTGYSVGDALYVNQAGFTEQAKFTVTAVNGTGGVTAIQYGITTGNVQEIWELFTIDTNSKRRAVARDLSYSNTIAKQYSTDTSYLPATFAYDNGRTDAELVVAPMIKTPNQLEVWCNVVPPPFSGSSTPTAGFPDQFHDVIAYQAAVDILLAAKRRLEAESYRQGILIPRLREMLSYAMLQYQDHPILKVIGSQLSPVPVQQRRDLP